MRDPWNVFLATFFTLDYAFEEALDPSEGLREYLSDANPFLWKGKGSADPAIWIEFERDYLERFPSGDAPDSESLAFVRAYLSQQGPYFIGVSPEGTRPRSSSCLMPRPTSLNGRACSTTSNDRRGAER